MNLDPRDRKSWQGFLELLQPPAGYRLASAVGTSFGLSFDALTAGLLAMCDTDGEELASEPVAGVIAVTRLRSKVRVLVHPGTISGSARTGAARFVAMLDRLIVEVEPPAGLFHPKVWVLRFERIGSQPSVPEETARIIVCSRNLTGSTSFELTAVLEGKPAVAPGTPSEFSRDIADALEIWLTSAKKPVSQDVLQLPRFLRRIALEVPHEATSELRFRWQGQGRQPLVSGLPRQAKRTVVVSPFVRPQFVADLVSRTEQLHLVSTPECLDALDDVTFASLEAIRTSQGTPVLYQITDHGDPDGACIDSVHAKLVLFETPRGETTTFIGSANATGPGWGISGTANIEAMAEMRPGISIDRFIAAFIRENKTKVHPWVMEYDRSSRLEPDAVKEAERQMLAALRELARLDLSLRYDGSKQILSLSRQSQKSIAALRARVDPNLEFDFAPLLLNDRPDAWRAIQTLASGDVRFEGVPIEKVTAFVALRARSKQPPLEKVRLVLARLEVSEADLDERDDALREEILSTADPAAVLNALIQGLSYFRPGGSRAEREKGHGSHSIKQLLNETTLEKLLQAVALDPGVISEMRLLLGRIGGETFQRLCNDLEQVVRGITEEVQQ